MCVSVWAAENRQIFPNSTEAVGHSRRVHLVSLSMGFIDVVVHQGAPFPNLTRVIVSENNFYFCLFCYCNVPA